MPTDGRDSIIQTPEEIQQELNRIQYKRALSRRSFMQTAGIAGAGLASVALLSGCGTSSNALAAGVAESDVLNFALNLEYLEAQFYSFAVNGSGLSSADTGGTGTVSGGAKTDFSSDPEAGAIAAEIAADEVLHVKFLRTALGSAAVSQPNINLAALGSTASLAAFLTVARAFEDTGVSAYAGAATLLTGDNLQYAAQILAVEAYHAGNIRLKIKQDGISTSKTDAMDILPPPSGSNYFPTDANGLAIKRTTSQVLAIVYANSAAGTSSGGFFPNGVNGNIKTV